MSLGNRLPSYTSISHTLTQAKVLSYLLMIWSPSLLHSPSVLSWVCCTVVFLSPIQAHSTCLWFVLRYSVALFAHLCDCRHCSITPTFCCRASWSFCFTLIIWLAERAMEEARRGGGGEAASSCQAPGKVHILMQACRVNKAEAARYCCHCYWLRKWRKKDEDAAPKLAIIIRGSSIIMRLDKWHIHMYIRCLWSTLDTGKGNSASFDFCYHCNTMLWQS